MINKLLINLEELFQYLENIFFTGIKHQGKKLLGLPLLVVDYYYIYFLLLRVESEPKKLTEGRCLYLTIRRKPRKKPQSGNWPIRDFNPGSLDERQRPYPSTTEVVGSTLNHYSYILLLLLLLIIIMMIYLNWQS